MQPFVTAGAGFLLAVLWFDLMFDVQVRGRSRTSDTGVDPVDSIAAYYRRVTTDARPMNRFVALVMAGTLGALAVQVARGEGPPAARAASVVLAVLPIGLAGSRTVPAAVRLGASREPADDRLALARSILRQHVCCLVAIAGLLVVQLGWMG
jgi:hypothetical protein